MKTRTEIINWLIRHNNYKKHLEIGVYKSHQNFDKIIVDYKVGVDPGAEGYSEATHTMTSDEFFEQNKEKFDIVFIDGLHHSEQVYKDILNSLNILNEDGTIICHDMNPTEEFRQIVPRKLAIKTRKKLGRRGGGWNGDCWKAFVQLRMERDDLEMYVIDTDCGLGIIRRGSQEKLEDAELTYNNLDNNRKKWLNLISVKEFCDGSKKLF